MKVLKNLFGKKSSNCCSFNLDQEIEKAQQNKDKEKEKEKINQNKNSCCKNK